jgi:glycosyltransferase involved in cell wall biosynthesis
MFPKLPDSGPLPSRESSVSSQEEALSTCKTEPPTPQVSTVIPAFNAEDHIVEAVSSALGQQGVASEVIVVDDGSTDDTWRLLETFGESIRRVRQANAGPARARNQGARLARGEWLAFLDADDVWRPEKLLQQLAAADSETGMVYTDRLNFGDCERLKSRQSDGVRLYHGDAFVQLLQDNFVTLSSVMMRRSVFEDLGGFDETMAASEDWDLWLRYAARGPIGLCRQPLTLRRWHPGALTNKLEHMQEQRLRALRNAFELPRARTVKPSARRRAVARAWETAAWCAAASDPRKAACWYARAAWNWPWRLAPYKGILKCLLARR